jgi:hypothetical protein
METFFLFCFLFGALFTAISVVFGFAGSISAHIPGGHGDASAIGDLSHGHADASAMGHVLGHANGAAHTHVGGHEMAHASDHAEHSTPLPMHLRLPLLNPSALLAFITCFGATGYILTHFAGWPSFLAAPVAVIPGIVADVMIAFLIAKLIAGETVMHAVDYELEGTLGRVTVSIPANGVGEVVFSKGGTRRSEGARSLNATAIPYNTEVVIVEYVHGVALVQPYDEFVGRHERGLTAIEGPDSAERS